MFVNIYWDMGLLAKHEEGKAPADICGPEDCIFIGVPYEFEDMAKEQILKDSPVVRFIKSIDLRTPPTREELEQWKS